MEPEKNEREISLNLRREISQYDDRYRKVAQIAYYSQLKQIEQMNIFTKSTYDVELNLIFCLDGSLYDAHRKDEIRYFIIRTLLEEIPKLKNQFSLAYLYNSLSDYFFFKSIVHYLREEHFLKLKSIYIIGSGILAKIINKLSFGAINQFAYQKTNYLESLEEIQTKNKVTLGGNMVKSKMKLQEKNATNSQLEIGVKVIQNKLYGKKISAYPLTKNGIPVIIEDLIMKLLSNQKYLEAEGIMRKSCDIQQLQILQNHFIDDPDPLIYLKKLDDPYVVCGCLKKIFNNLFIPLFSYEIYQNIAAYRSTGKEEDDIDFTHKCVSKMDDLNRRVLIFLIGFLKKGIVTFKDKNKMSAYNLAVVFGPCLFRPKQYKLEDYMNSGKCSKIILLLIDHYQKIISEEVAIENFNLMEKLRFQYCMPP